MAIAAEIARRQHGVVTRRQLLGAEIHPSQVDRWLVRGLLHAEFSGVYRLGHRAPNGLARYAAAVLAAGPGAALAGLAAARLHEILRRGVPPPEVAGVVHRRAPGMVFHRVRRLERDEVTVVRGIRCTTLARTLVDCAAQVPLGRLATLHHEADVRYGLDADAVLALLERRPNTRNAAALRSVVIGDTPALLSRLERGFRGMVRERGYPKPLFNRPEGAHWVDVRWPQHRLTVELNGFRFHRSRRAWEADMERERAARRRGDRFRRYSWHDVFEDRAYLLETLDALLPRR